jgi:lysophospholipase L1-like esterase
MDRDTYPLRPLLGPVTLLALGLIPAGAMPGAFARVSLALRDDGPNARDYDQIERGYYERLIETSRRPEGTVHAAQVPFDAGILAQTVDDAREYVLKPNLVATHEGATWSTNSLGMRDRPYDATKPRGTFRIGLAGDSIAAGWGVDDGLGFEPTLERGWDERSKAAGGPGIEVLNFAVPGHAPGQRWEHFTRVGWGTGPDLVIFAGTPADLGWDERRLRALIPRGLGRDAPVYREALAGVIDIHDPEKLKSILRPRREAILLGVYRRIVADCRERGVPVVWVLLPRVGKDADPRDRARLAGLAGSAGFDRRVDLSDAFEGRPASTLAIAPDDFHPNAAGHAELARRIDTALGEFVSSSATSSRPENGERPRATAPAPAGDPAR